ncbi:MAG: hypothetical protein AB7F40_07895 [Victivallaceae bacterium]|nr:hypothetical protein [Victivallaceae bacterium]
MKNALILAAVAVLVTACGPSEPRVIDTTQTTGRVRSMQKLSPVDFQEAALNSVNKMLASKQFARYLTQYQAGNTDQPLLMLSEVVNKTSTAVNTQVLTERISTALSEDADMVQVTTAAAGAGQHRDEANAQVRDLENDINFDQSTVQQRGTLKAPNLSLSGTIVEQRVQESGTTELTYFFSLKLTDLRSGVQVFSTTQEIGRQQD